MEGSIWSHGGGWASEHDDSSQGEEAHMAQQSFEVICEYYGRKSVTLNSIFFLVLNIEDSNNIFFLFLFN